MKITQICDFSNATCGQVILTFLYSSTIRPTVISKIKKQKNKQMQVYVVYRNTKVYYSSL